MCEKVYADLSHVSMQSNLHKSIKAESLAKSTSE